MAVKNEIKLYIHIPFCVRKCNYCDFLSFALDDSAKEKYVAALLQQIEIESKIAKEKGYYHKVSSIYMGGGTPSCLTGNQIKQIMDKVYECFDIAGDSENTIEVNPGTVELCKLKEIKEAGFNRISIGMQSGDDEELKELGRIHKYSDFVECYQNARAAGFGNINVDVMTALWGQTKEKLTATLNKLIELNPEHIAAYSLIIEEDTPFYEKYGDIEGPVIGEDAERELYHMTADILHNAGYEHYEISNFSRKESLRSDHNCGYWRRIPYIGLGLGAASLIRYDIDKTCEMRIQNTTDLEKYLNNPMLKEEETIVSKEEAMDEYMFLGLRMSDGVSPEEFADLYGENMNEIYGSAIEKLLKQKLIKTKNGRYSLTQEGIDYGNYVFSMFLR